MFLEILYKALVFYFLLAFLIRFMGKREVGKINVFDFVILVLIADIASIAIENPQINYLFIVMVLVALTVLQKLISYINLKFYKVRNIIDGKPAILIFNGQIQFEEFKKNLYTIEDLLIEMRSQSIKCIKEIELAVLEINGKLNIFKRDPNDKNIPLPLIISGHIVYENLKYLKISEEEINQKLKIKNIEVKDILYATLEKEDIFLIENE